MDRELLIELGVEELPASGLPPLPRQLAEVTDAQVRAQRLGADAQAEAYSTPRRLAVRVSRLAERQTGLGGLITRPPLSAGERAHRASRLGGERARRATLAGRSRVCEEERRGDRRARTGRDAEGHLPRVQETA